MRETIEAFAVFIMLCLAFFIGLMIGSNLDVEEKAPTECSIQFLKETE